MHRGSRDAVAVAQGGRQSRRSLPPLRFRPANERSLATNRSSHENAVLSPDEQAGARGPGPRLVAKALVRILQCVTTKALAGGLLAFARRETPSPSA